MRTLLILLTLLFSYPTSAQEVDSLPGMEEAMAEMVKAKYRSRESSASPWQSNVIVTAAHIDSIIPNELCTYNIYDTKFVEQNNLQTVKWRSPVVNEDVEMLGKLTILSEDKQMSIVMEIKVIGKVLRETSAIYKGNILDFLWLGSGMTIKGMSGGPVVSLNDGAIVGMVIGRPAPGIARYKEDRAKYQELFFFVPYDTINNAWKNCLTDK